MVEKAPGNEISMKLNNNPVDRILHSAQIMSSPRENGEIILSKGLQLSSPCASSHARGPFFSKSSWTEIFLASIVGVKGYRAIITKY